MQENRVQQEPKSILENLRVINQIGVSILSELTIEQIIETVYHHVNQLMDAYSFAIGVLNPATGNLDYTGARENDQKLPPFSIHADDASRFSGWVALHKESILINDYEAEYKQYVPEPIQPLQGIQPASLMYVPVMVHKEVMGILSVRTMRKHAYNEQSLEILKTLSVFIGKAIENSRTIKHATKPLPSHYKRNPLSARELEVLNLLSKGFKNKAIAGELFISDSTVKTHTLNIYQKLDAATRTEAIAKAREYGLIS